MNFDCQICSLQYSQKIKPKVIECGHTMCEACINKLIRNSNPICPYCCKEFKNIDRQKFPTVYQLITYVENPKNSNY